MNLIDLYLSSGIDLVSRTIYLSGEKSAEINAHAAERFIISMNLLIQSATKKNNKILIVLNCIGGDFYHSLAVFDSIRLCPCPVRIQVIGQAFSAGAFILQASEDRYMSFNSKFMMHHGKESGSDHPKILKNWAKESDKSMKWQARLFYDRIKLVKPGITEKQVDKMLDFDTVLNAHEALELNLIDGILLPGGKIERRNNEKTRRTVKSTNKRRS